MKVAAGTMISAKYRLDHPLGQGGMGVVWEAEHVDTGEKVAIKLLKESTGDADARRRFLREGRAAQAVKHPNVVKILDVLELEDGAPAIVMERLEGESLGDKLRREHRIELPELANLLVPVVSAVGTAHAAGVVHRDLKPENIFLCRGEGAGVIAKVLDFGIAKLITLDDEAMRSTGITTGAVLGTPTYMAPEQVFGERDVDHGADVWALGLILYHCLSGVLPTQAENVGQVLKNVLAKPFDPIDRLVPDLPEDVSRLVMRMLARDRDLRPADLREVLGVLEKHAAVPATGFGPPSGRSTTPSTAPSRGASERAGSFAWMGREQAPRRRRQRRVLVALALLGAGVEGWLVLAARTAGPVVAVSPLAAPSTTIACPILRASGVDPPAGWLGAAAAATACERARVILGGRPERTLVPAELLDLPRQPVDSFPADPYGYPDARERSLSAARSRATAYLDGDVVYRGSEFSIRLELHRADGTEITRAQGVGTGLYAAVRAAMEPLVGATLIPQASALDPQIAAWSGTSEIAAALGLLDLTFALAHNAGGLSAECERFKQTSTKLGELGAAGLWLCAYEVGRPTPDVVLDGPEASPEAVATRIRLRHFITHSDKPGDADRLHGYLDRELTPWGKSLLAATESCLVQSSDSKRAYDLASFAVQAEPKNPDGQLCNPWEQLLSLADGTASADSTARAMQAWVPWNGLGWFAQGHGTPSLPQAVALLRRAYVLAPLDTQVVDAFAGKLLAAGDRAEARAVAVAVRSGGSLVHELENDLLLLRVEASEAHFRAALERALRISEISRDDAGWVRVQRFEAAWRSLELASILGRTAEIADQLIRRFLDPEPPVLDGSTFLVARRIPAICAVASEAMAARCFKRFCELQGRLSAGTTTETGELLRGAECYAQRDFRGAAKAWRPLLRGSNVLALVLPDAMVEAFERSGDVELAEQVDAAEMHRANELNGATLAHVRAARRALRRGDVAGARALAKTVVDAWSVADEEVPAVTEMRRLLGR